MHQINRSAHIHWTGQSLKGCYSEGCKTLFQNWESHARKNLHSPQCSPPWFTKHHLHCYTNTNALLGDKLELEQTACQHAAALLAPTAQSSARPACNHRSKPGSVLIFEQIFDLEFNLPIYIFQPRYFTVQISLARSVFKELSSKGTTTAFDPTTHLHPKSSKAGTN